MRAFQQRGLGNTARVLPASPLLKSTSKSIAPPHILTAPVRLLLAPFSPTEFLHIKMTVCLLHAFEQRGLDNTAIGQPSSPLLKSTSKSIAPPHILATPVRLLLAPFSPTEFLHIKMTVCLLHAFEQRGLDNTAIGQPASQLLKSTSKSIAPSHILTTPVRAA